MQTLPVKYIFIGCYSSCQSSPGPGWTSPGQWQLKPHSSSAPVQIIVIAVVYVPLRQYWHPSPMTISLRKLRTKKQYFAIIKNWNWLFQNTSFNLVGDDFSFHGNRNKNKHDNFCTFTANASAIKYRNTFHSKASTSPAHIPMLPTPVGRTCGPLGRFSLLIQLSNF